MPVLKSKAHQFAIQGVPLAPVVRFLCTLLARLGIARPKNRSATSNPVDGMELIRRRLADEKSRLDSLDAERESCGESGLAKVREDRIVWHELIELELQDIDEQVTRIRLLSGGKGDGHAPAPAASSVCAKEVLMSTTSYERLDLNSSEFAILTELLEATRTKLMIEIRHTDHRVFRDELRRRLAVVERLLDRCR